MDSLSGVSASSLFSAIPSQLSTLSNIALTRGIDLYQNGSYEDAIKEFKRAVGLSPQSENALKAYDFLATTYLQLEKAEDAIDTYTSSLELVPSDSDTHVKLANLYFGLNRYTEAETEYKMALRLDRNSTADLYSLLATERYVENLYNWRITRASPGAPGGAYSWGLSIPSTEIEIRMFPINVIYDSDSLTAQVTFQITQNSCANATIDPSHIVFRFYGKDVYGNTMDPAADEYSGISKIV